jgi:hypothetical protein
MSDFVAEEENIREIEINLEELPDSLIYKLPEIEWTFSPEKFGIGEYLNIEYYERRFEKAFPGLLNQFPMLYYMVEEWYAEATKRTPLEEIEMKKELNQ